MKEDAAPSVRFTNQGEVDGGDGWRGEELPGAESLEGPGAALRVLAATSGSFKDSGDRSKQRADQRFGGQWQEGDALLTAAA